MLGAVGGRDGAGSGGTEAAETVAVRIARQRAATALRGHRQQAAGSQLDDGIIAPLGACLKALRVILARFHGVELRAVGNGAASFTDESLHHGIELQGFFLRRGRRHLQKDIGDAEHLQKGIPRVYGKILGADEEHGGGQLRQVIAPLFLHQRTLQQPVQQHLHPAAGVFMARVSMPAVCYWAQLIRIIQRPAPIPTTTSVNSRR